MYMHHNKKHFQKFIGECLVDSKDKKAPRSPDSVFAIHQKFITLIEDQLLPIVLRESKNNRGRASRFLGINQSILRRKLKERKHLLPVTSCDHIAKLSVEKK